MILRNYYNMLAAHTLGIESTDTTTFGDGHINIKDRYGDLKQIFVPGGLSEYGVMASFGFIKQYGSSASYRNCITIMFGTGNTAVTFDDFVLQAPISDSDLTCATFNSTTPVYNSASKKFTGSRTMLLTNTSGSSKTINEVGIYMRLSNDNYTCLVYREVLANPFTLAAGESVTYTQNLEFTMPE